VDKPLSETIKSSTSLPGVTGSHMLTDGSFGAPGSRRLNCLSDGSTLVEEVLLREQRSDSMRFRYTVWNYTSSKARPIVYGVGEFTYSAADNGRTHVRTGINQSRFGAAPGWRLAQCDRTAVRSDCPPGNILARFALTCQQRRRTDPGSRCFLPVQQPHQDPSWETDHR
jgi:hypothetical protein